MSAAAPAAAVPPALATSDVRRVLLLQGAFHRDPAMAGAAWSRLLQVSGGGPAVVEWANRGPERRLLPALWARRDLLALPPEVDEECRDVLAEAWGLNTRLLAAVRPAVVALVEAGVPVVALKGLALLGDVYPDQALRPIGDVDLLVPRRLALRALELLKAAGWHGPSPYPPFWLAGRHAINLGSSLPGPSIDLHWRASGSVPHRAWQQPWPEADLEELPAMHPFAGLGVRRAVTERLLVQVAAHGMQLENADLSHWIADLDRMLASDRGLDGERVARIAAEDGLVLEVLAALRACEDVLGTPTPFDLRLLEPPSRRAVQQARARREAAARTRQMAQQSGSVAKLLRFGLYIRRGTLPYHVTAGFQVACAVAATWFRVRRSGRGEAVRGVPRAAS